LDPVFIAIEDYRRDIVKIKHIKLSSKDNILTSLCFKYNSFVMTINEEKEKVDLSINQNDSILAMVNYTLLCQALSLAKPLSSK
jgi:hypothetical protein